jgi:hypothetical protein
MVFSILLALIIKPYMKKYTTIFTLFFILFAVASCKKETTNTGFTDGLTFGTSVNYTNFTLIGEGNSFGAVPGNVTFRLESEEDFNGNPVKFVVLKSGVIYSTNVFVSNPVPTGHIFITSLNFALTGQYSVNAFIQKASGDKDVASGTFQMN